MFYRGGIFSFRYTVCIDIKKIDIMHCLHFISLSYDMLNSRAHQTKEVSTKVKKENLKITAFFNWVCSVSRMKVNTLIFLRT